MKYKLGKKPARPGAVSFKFGAFFDRKKLPVPPPEFGHEWIGTSDWGMLANDVVSNCVFAGAAHETMLWGHLKGAIPKFSDRTVIGDYSAATGFDPARPETDQGSDMTESAEFRRRIGVLDSSGVRHKIDAYVALDPHRLSDIALATYLFGAVGVGLRFPDYAMDQFDAHRTWDYVPGMPEPEGGHYVPCVGRAANGNLRFISWGRIHSMTPRFVERYCDEALAYVSFEGFKEGVSPEGFDAATLRHHLAALAA